MSKTRIGRANTLKNEDMHSISRPPRCHCCSCLQKRDEEDVIPPHLSTCIIVGREHNKTKMADASCTPMPSCRFVWPP